MGTTHPNRNGGQETGSEESRRKQSGDQHDMIADENTALPERRHRMDRGNLQQEQGGKENKRNDGST
jgi:hypothetical protein